MFCRFYFGVFWLFFLTPLFALSPPNDDTDTRNMHDSLALKKNNPNPKIPPDSSKKLENIGIQLYSVRKAMKKDFEGTLKKIAAIGFTEVEFAGFFGHTPSQVKRLLSGLNLKAIASHVPWSELNKNPEKLIKETKEMGIPYMVIAWFPPYDRISLGQYKKHVKLFNEVGAMCKKAGIQFVYHNHDFEFNKKSGKVPFDVLLQETDPDLVKFELDLYWIVKAGKDPLDYYKKYPGRFVLSHVKDMNEKGKMVDVGEGSLDFKNLLDVKHGSGIKHYIVEHDNPKKPFESMEKGFKHLQSLSW